MDNFDLLAHDASTRMRWWAQMNAWHTPKEFPDGFVESDFKSHHDYETLFPKWTAAMRAISSSLSWQQTSWAWWREEKLGTYDEWRAWRNFVVSIDENGEPLK